MELMRSKTPFEPEGPGIKTEFRTDLGVVVGRLGRSLAATIRTLPDKPRHAADLRRALDIDTKLSTQIFRIAKAHRADPAAVAFHVPGPPSMNRFIAAAQRAKIDQPLVQSVSGAYEEFLAFVTRVAGDRVTFDSMAADIATADGVGQQGDFLSVQHRKTAYRAMSHLLGVQAHTLYRCAILHRSAAGPFDFAQLRLYRQVRRLSASAPVTLFRNRSGHQSGRPLVDEFHRAPIDPDLPNENGANLFPQFSSDPTPQVRVVQGSRGSYHINLLGNTVGNLGAVDCAFGHVDRRIVADIVRRDANPAGVTAAAATTGIYFPTGRLLCDFAVPAGLFDPTSIKALIYSNVYEIELNDYAEWQTLPLNARHTRLDGVEEITDATYPRYGNFVHTVLDKLGWRNSKFEVHRLSLEYPVLFSSVNLVLDQVAH